MSAPDYRVGDVLRAEHSAWPEGSFIEGAVYDFAGSDSLYVCGWQVRAFARDYWTITVVSRAKRPFYVNVDRDPVAGDIFRSDDPADDDDNVTYSPSGGWGNTDNDRFWENLGGATFIRADLPPRRRLLIDGTTGKVVES